jgi:hypothetical protein
MLAADPRGVFSFCIVCVPSFEPMHPGQRSAPPRDMPTSLSRISDAQV